MFETLKRIYQQTKSEAYLDKAVTRKWITEEQKMEIINSSSAL